MATVTGDVRDIMPLMRSGVYGAVVTSPPYNIGVNYGASVNDSLSVEAYSKFTRFWIAEAMRLAPVAIVNFGAPTSDPLNLARFMIDAASVAVIQQHIIWVKAISSDDWSYGHFKPVNSKRYMTNLHESIFVLSRDGSFPLDRLAVGVPFKDKSNIARFKSNTGDKRCRGNVWFVPYETKQRANEHPAAYPEELASMMIRLAGCPARVLDPFYGSGTTDRAAAKLGVSCDGIDIKEW